MKILIYGLNFSPELTGIGKYTGELAQWLVKAGHPVRVITTAPYYPQWKVQTPYRAFSYQPDTLDGIDVHRCPLWVPTHPTALKRIIHLLSFAISSLPVYLRHMRWADVVF